MRHKDEIITLKRIAKSDYNFLYELLNQRKTNENISHKRMPTYKEHVRFIKSVPYSKWYIIKHRAQKIGSIYLTENNEVGIWLVKEIDSNFLKKRSLELLMQLNPRLIYYVNVNPKNKKFSNFLKRNGFSIIQHTYQLDPRRFNHQN